MTDHDIREILSQVEEPAALRAGFEDELFAKLAAELGDIGDSSAAEAGWRRRLGQAASRLPARRWLLVPVALATAAALVAGVVVLKDGTTPSPSEKGASVAAPDPGPDNDIDEGDAPTGRGSGRGEGPGFPDVGGPVGLPGIITPLGDEGGRVPPVPPPSGGGPQDLDVLAFASMGNDGYWHIYTMKVDGTDRTRLTNAAAHDREPDWSPDGTKITFMRIANEGDHTGEIFVMNANGSNERFLAFGGEPQWSPDGSHIAYTARSHVGGQPAGSPSIWVMDADGSNQRKLFSGEGAAADVTWSPVGGLLAFAGVAPDLPPDPTGGSQTTNLYTMTEEGTLVRRLTNTYYACNSEFSPDGTRLAFITSDGGPFVVWSMNVDGSDKTQLTRGPGTYAFPHWSPDGARIAFGLDPDGEPHWILVPQTAGPIRGAIWSIAADGSDLKRISPQDAYDADPAFAPRSVHRETTRRNSLSDNDESVDRAAARALGSAAQMSVC